MSFPQSVDDEPVLTSRVGKYAGRHGTKMIISLGLALSSLGLLLCRLVHADRVEQRVVLVILLIVTGAGLSLTLTGVMAEWANNHASAWDFGVYNVSCMLPMVLASFAFGDYDHRGGWRLITTVLGGACVVAAFFATTSHRISTGSTAKHHRSARGSIASAEDARDGNPDVVHPPPVPKRREDAI